MRPLSKVETRRGGSIPSLTLYFPPSVFMLFCVFCRSSEIADSKKNILRTATVINLTLVFSVHKLALLKWMEKKRLQPLNFQLHVFNVFCLEEKKMLQFLYVS